MAFALRSFAAADGHPRLGAHAAQIPLFLREGRALGGPLDHRLDALETVADHSDLALEFSQDGVSAACSMD